MPSEHMLATAPTALKPRYHIPLQSTNLTHLQQVAPALVNDDRHSVNFALLRRAASTIGLPLMNEGRDLATTTNLEGDAILRPSSATLTSTPMPDPSVDSADTQLAMRDLLTAEELPGHEPHPGGALPGNEPVEGPHSSSVEPTDSLGTDVLMPSCRTPRRRATPKTETVVERKHWSLSYVTRPMPADTTQSSVDCWTHSKVRHSCGTLSDQEVVTQGTSKVRQPRAKSPLAHFPSDPIDSSNTIGMPRAPLLPWTPSRKAINQVLGHPLKNGKSVGHPPPLTSNHTMSISATTQPQQFSSPWILPPLPSFTELGLQFDSSNTNNQDVSSDSVALPQQGNSPTLFPGEHSHQHEIQEQDTLPEEQPLQ
ncbi:MAG: hypothetical protein J3Q66DRAFT_438278, partial [Benniella sp.]